MTREALRRGASALVVALAVLIALGDTAQALGYMIGRPWTERFEAQVDFTDPALTPLAPSGEVIINHSIDSSTGEVSGLGDGDRFGEEVAAIGDVNGDGTIDIAVGARFHEDVGLDRGGVWVLLMRPNGTVLDSTLISETEGGFRRRLRNSDHFGSAIAPIGDIDGDGIPDIAVGAFQDDTAGLNAGAVHVLTLNSDGSVKSEKRITQGLGGFVGPLATGDGFGRDIANIGDVNGDGNDDIAVGAIGDDDAGIDAGAVWILLLDATGDVTSARKLTTGSNGFSPSMSAGDGWGGSLTGIGDIDNDGVPDMAMGSPDSPIGGVGSGAVHILRMNATGSVKAVSTISGMGNGLSFSGEGFGQGIAGVGDTNNDAIEDIAIGIARHDASGADQGRIRIVRLTTTGSMIDTIDVDQGSAGFDSSFQNDEQFGRSIASLGDFDDNNVVDLVVGTWGVDRGGSNRGAAWMITLAQAPPGDADGDGVSDQLEDRNGDYDFTNDDTDGDGTPDYLDTDDDGDGVGTAYEFPTTGDLDGDGTPDYLDTDDDGDSIDTADENPDSNGDQNPADAWDLDGDGLPDYRDSDPTDGPLADADGDTVPNGIENPGDTDGDGLDDWLDIDDDGDGIDTVHESPSQGLDSDGDGIPNYRDDDDDGDGVLTIDELPDLDGDGNPADASDLDGDGIPDYLDLFDDRIGPTTTTATTTTIPPATTTTTAATTTTTTTSTTSSTTTTEPTGLPREETTTTTRVPRPPTLAARDDAVTTVRDTEVTVRILDNDLVEAGLDPSTIEVSGVNNGTFTINPDGSVTIVPEAGFTGTITFDYFLVDEVGNTSSATVFIEVLPPQLSYEAQTLAEVTRPESTVIAAEPPSVSLFSVFLGVLQLTGDFRLPLRLLLSAAAWSVLVMVVISRWRRMPHAGLVEGIAKGQIVDVVNRRGSRTGYALTATSDLVWVTGRRKTIGKVRHLEVETPLGKGYVPAEYIGNSVELHTEVLNSFAGS